MLRFASNAVPVAVAIVAGVLGWDLMRLLGEGPTLWASWTYWWIGLPIMVFAAFVLGLGYPRNAWRWGVMIVGAQMIWSVVLAYMGGHELLLSHESLSAFSIVGAACVVTAIAGAFLRSRLDRLV